MAIVFSNLGASTNPDLNDNTDATSYSNSSWTPPASGLIIVFVHARGSSAGAAVAPSVSGNSLTWTQIASDLRGSDRLTLFAANASGSTTGANTFDFGSNGQLNCTAAFMQATGVDLSGGVAACFVQAVTAQGNTSTGAITLSAASNSDNRPVSGWWRGANESVTPRTNWDEYDELAGTGPVRVIETQARSDAFETTASATWGSAGAWIGIAAELKMAASGMAGAATGATVTPAVTLNTATVYSLTAAAIGASATLNTIALPVARAIASTASGATATPTTVALPVARTLADVSAAASVTAAPRLNVPYAGTTAGLLTVHPTNSRYFQAGGTGPAQLLTGSHTWHNFQDAGLGDPPPVFDYGDYLDYLIARGHNFIRLWRWEQSRWVVEETSSNYWFNPGPPYARSATSGALDGKNKWDLDQLDEAWLDRLEARVKDAADAGLYVSVMLFQGWSPYSAKGGFSGGTPWYGNPFHSTNNVNSIDGDTDNDDSGEETHTLSIAAVTAYQEVYVAWLLDRLNDYSNLIWEISNESDSSSIPWQSHFVDYIHTYEAALPQQHLVWLTATWPNSGTPEADFNATNADLFSYHGDWGYSLTNPDVATGTPGPHIHDVDHVLGVSYTLDWPWISFARGHHPILMDEYDGIHDFEGGDDMRADATAEEVRYSMGRVLAWANTFVDLAAMTPQNAKASTSFCLASTATPEFWIYAPSGGTFTVDLSGLSESFAVTWQRCSDGATQGATTISGGSATQSVTSPYGAVRSVLYLRETTVYSLAAAGTGVSATSALVANVARSVAAGATGATASAAPILARVLLLAASGTAATDTGAGILRIDRLLAASATAASVTVDTGALAIARSLASIAGIVVVTSAPLLPVERHLTMGATVTSATGVIAVGTETGWYLTASASAASGTPDAVLPVARRVSFVAGSLTQTNPALLPVARSLTATCTLVTTSGAAALETESFWFLTASASVSSATPIVTWTVARGVTLAAGLDSTTGALVVPVARSLSMARSAPTYVPGIVLRQWVRQMAAAATGESSTRDWLDVRVARSLAFSAAAASETSAPLVAVDRPLTLDGTAVSDTPDTAALAIVDYLTMAASGATDAAAPILAQAIPLAMAGTLDSATPVVTWTVARGLALNATGASVTPNTATITMALIIGLMHLAATGRRPSAGATGRRPHVTASGQS